MEITLLECPKCNHVGGCIQPIRWGVNPHFCSLCGEQKHCVVKRMRMVKTSFEYTCIDCVDQGCSEVCKNIARRSCGHTQ